MMRRGETRVRCDSALTATSFGIFRMHGWRATHRAVSWLTIQEWILGKEARAGRWGLGSCVHVCECTMPLVFDRGGIIILPVTPEECRVRFLLCEWCRLTCRHHADTISFFSFPPQPGEFPSLCGFRRKLQNLYKQCFSGNAWILQVMASLPKLCFFFLSLHTIYSVLEEGRKNATVWCFQSVLVLIMYKHRENKPEGLCGWSANGVIACLRWREQGCFVMLGV